LAARRLVRFNVRLAALLPFLLLSPAVDGLGQYWAQLWNIQTGEPAGLVQEANGISSGASCDLLPQ
jgi:hypothetical protein